MVCNNVADSAIHTHSRLSRSADITRRESIITTTELIGELWPYTTNNH